MKFATGLIVLLSALACTSPVDQARPKEVGSNQSQRADALPDDNNPQSASRKSRRSSPSKTTTLTFRTGISEGATTRAISF